MIWKSSAFIFLASLLYCCKNDNPDETTEPSNELVGTTWKWVYRQENNKEIYSVIRFRDGSSLEVSSNDNSEGAEKLNQVYRYSYDDASKKISYALEERPFCQGDISGDSMRVTCSIQRVFKKVP